MPAVTRLLSWQGKWKVRLLVLDCQTLTLAQLYLDVIFCALLTYSFVLF